MSNPSLYKKHILEQMIDWGVDVLPPGEAPISSEIKGGDKQMDSSLSEVKGLDQLKSTLGNCQRCPLGASRTHLVFGEGYSEARLMFVGEGPGADEDESGRPFVGRAGKLLTDMIKAMGLERDQVYIANVVKCRPPNNRNPEPVEIAHCIPFLKKQVELISPKVIVALGKFAAQTLLQTEIPITKLRGEFHDYGSVKLMPTYHPAYLLRNPTMKRAVWEDLKKVMALLELPIKPN